MFKIGGDGKKIIENFQVGSLKISPWWWLIIAVIILIIVVAIYNKYKS